MTDLEKLRNWIATFPGYDILKTFHVDFTDQIPSNGGIYPGGLVEVFRKRDIWGNTMVRNQYNFGLYYVFLKDPGDSEGAAINADWLMEFQLWVQEQSVRRQAPIFGDEPRAEQIRAQNGVLYAAENEGTATYMVQLSVEFTKYYQEGEC